MREAFARGFTDLSRHRDDLFLVVADISPASALKEFLEERPSRFVDVGISEQAMIGVAAGLALRGFRPFAYTIANFVAYRPYEQVRIDLCYQELPVVLVGVGAGLSYSALGTTHHTVEDVGLMRALPNMTVLAPCDPIELIACLDYAVGLEGPAYLRLGKSGEPILTSKADAFVPGRLRNVSAGTDAAIVGYGPILRVAFEAAELVYRSHGWRPTIYSAHTLNPFDYDGLAAIAETHVAVVSIEEHFAVGGLSDIIDVWKVRTSSPVAVDHAHLQHRYLHEYGTHEQLLNLHGISSTSLAALVTSTVERACD